MQVEAMSLKVLSRCRRKWGKVLKPPPRRMSGIGGWGWAALLWAAWQPGGVWAGKQGVQGLRPDEPVRHVRGRSVWPGRGGIVCLLLF